MYISTSTTEEFEQGSAILEVHNNKRNRQRKHLYLLTGLLYLQRPNESKLIRLTGSTPNSRRKGGGTSDYWARSTDINLQCQSIDEQVADAIKRIQVDPASIPATRRHYTDETGQLSGSQKLSGRQQMETALHTVDEEKAG
jgi:hypothetical protein